jgi:PBP1b-binding outer membrane lipoprotein LpoB
VIKLALEELNNHKSKEDSEVKTLKTTKITKTIKRLKTIKDHLFQEMAMLIQLEAKDSMAKDLRDKVETVEVNNHGLEIKDPLEEESKLLPLTVENNDMSKPLSFIKIF